jgi:hypothetical protein
MEFEIAAAALDAASRITAAALESKTVTSEEDAVKLFEAILDAVVERFGEEVDEDDEDEEHE